MTTESPNHGGGAAASPGGMGPITAGQRIAAVDVLRGLAILVIFTGNFYYYSHPFALDFQSYLEFVGIDPSTQPFNVGTFIFLDLSFQLTLYSLYGFLFGFGVSIMMGKAEAVGAGFGKVYLRRLLALFAIGVCHVVFLWAGDILITYSITGIVLLFYRKRAPRGVLKGALVFTIIWIVAFSGLPLLMALAGQAQPAASQPVAETTTLPATTTPSAPVTTTTTAPTSQPTFQSMIMKWLRLSIDTYSHGTYGEVLKRRIKDYVIWTGMIAYHEYPLIIAMMLLGVYTGRRGILSNLDEHRSLIRQVAIWGFVLGVGGNLVALAVQLTTPMGEPSWKWVAYTLGRGISAPTLTMFYAAGGVLLVANGVLPRLIKLFVPVGRMSLSNYLFQSLICTTICYGYGLGYFGRISPPLGIVLGVVLFFVVQVPLSAFWMTRFRFGPIEWLWRTLTYGKLQAMRPDNNA
ncbi:MAG: DUF418 domain-containing protein [Phycisphaerae bacterium]|nr:DUF418 domain-containing protein [Phycisphaerae bacterium]